MLGFVAAVAAELNTGRTVAEQVRISPGPIAAVFALFSVASLIPILKVCLSSFLCFLCLMPESVKASYWTYAAWLWQ